MSNIMPRLENGYANFAKYALSGYRPIVFFIGTLVLMVVSIGFFIGSNPKIVLFPDNEPKYVNVFIEAPLGTDIYKTDEITKELEKRISTAIAPHDTLVEAMLAQVGEKTSDPNEGPQSGSSPHKARITVSFLEYSDRVFIPDNVSTS